MCVCVCVCVCIWGYGLGHLLVFLIPGEKIHPQFFLFVSFLLYSFFFFLNLFIYLFLAVLGLHFCARTFSSCGERGPLSSRCAGLSSSRPLLLRSTGSRRAGSVVVAHGPSCSAACGIFPDQGSSPCPLHWQADSQPLRHQGSPLLYSFILIPIVQKGVRIMQNC